VRKLAPRDRYARGATRQGARADGAWMLGPYGISQAVGITDVESLTMRDWRGASEAGG